MDTLLNSTALTRLHADAPTFGYALAMGKDTFTDVGDRLFAAGLSDPENITPEIVRPLYDEIRKHAEEIGRAKHKPMKDQKESSRVSQASKLSNFVQLATCAQDNDAVTAAYTWMRESDPKKGYGLSGYTKVQSALVALKKALGKDPLADLETLQQAIRDSQAKAPETASEAVGKAIDAMLKATGEDSEEASPHADAFGRLLKANPQDPVKAAMVSLMAIKAWFEREEQAKEQAAALAAGGLSI